MNFGVENWFGLFGLIGLVVVIILYFIQPKIKVLDVPSLSFFFKQKKTSLRNVFLRKIKFDWLFLLQLLIVLLLCLAALKIWVLVDRDLASGNTVIVLDVSASSKVINEDGKTRLDVMKEKAGDVLGDKNSVILIKKEPVIALQGVGKSEVRDFLSNLESTDSSGAVGDAMLMAGELLTGQKGRVFVFSDFKSTSGVNPEIARSVLLSKGLGADLIDLSSEDDKIRNVGFINILLDKEFVEVFVKNYNSNDENVKIDFAEGKVITVKANSVEVVRLDLAIGMNEIKLEAMNNDFNVDDTLYLYRPEKKNVQVLLISDNVSSFLKAALVSSGDVDVDVKELPVLPEKRYDVYIIDSIDSSKLLPGMFRDLKNRIEAEGSALVINSFDGIENSEVYDALGFKVVNLTKEATSLVIERENDLTNEIDFGSVISYYSLDGESGVNLVSANGVSVVNVNQIGKGYVIYNGVSNKFSDFYLSPSYPVFWTRLVKMFGSYKGIEDVNFYSGDIYLEEELDNVGFKQLTDQIVGVNLLNDKESDLLLSEGQEYSVNEYKIEPIKEEVRYELTYYLLIVIFILFIIELVYIKIRGDV